jgi:type I restriction-modification system DNA methylase subunit
MLISGILVALENEAFKKGYKVHNTAQELADSLVNSVVSEFMRSGLPQERIKNLKHAFSFIQVNATITADKDFFVGLIEQIDQNVKRFLATDQFYDAIGQFYVQFLRYANNDKGLGIVLTPAHIAELFADLAEVGKKSVVYDNCCGTAGLLIAAMKRMLKDAKSDEETEKAIKDQQLIGVEFQPHIYALAVSNMVVHRDGKTSIKNGDCFTLTSQIRDKYKPTVGVLNPPYQTKNNPIHELEFVLNNLETLQPNGKCIAIVPFSCAIGEDRETSDRKRRIMEAHTLEGVMTMPADLFHDSDTNVVTCIMVITAHKPHPKGKKTWFGYWRNDGFIKVKNKGRIDADGRWDSIKTGWLTAYRNKTEIKGLGVMKEVSATDEWCAEAYMEPDWSRLNRDELTKTFKEFAVHRLLMETGHA